MAKYYVPFTMGFISPLPKFPEETQDVYMFFNNPDQAQEHLTQLIEQLPDGREHGISGCGPNHVKVSLPEVYGIYDVDVPADVSRNQAMFSAQVQGDWITASNITIGSDIIHHLEQLNETAFTGPGAHFESTAAMMNRTHQLTNIALCIDRSSDAACEKTALYDYGPRESLRAVFCPSEPTSVDKAYLNAYMQMLGENMPIDVVTRLGKPMHDTFNERFKETCVATDDRVAAAAAMIMTAKTLLPNARSMEERAFLDAVQLHAKNDLQQFQTFIAQQEKASGNTEFDYIEPDETEVDITT